MTRRQLSREPARLNNIKPGESVVVPDTKGGLVVTRPRKQRISVEAMFARLDTLTAECPPLDTLACQKDEE